MKSNFNLFSNCIVVDGASRSLICDLQKIRYIPIPNLLSNVLKIANYMSIDELKKHFKNEYNQGIDAYFKMLFEENYGFYHNDFALFPKLDLTWDSPNRITNAIFEITSDNNSYFEVIKNIESVDTEILQLVFDNFDKGIFVIMELSELLSKSSIKYVECIIPYSKNIIESNIQKILIKNVRYRTIYFYNSPTNKESELKNIDSTVKIFYLKHKINTKGHFSPQFLLNIVSFSEAQKNNLYYNRKVAINSSREIKNCLTNNEIFGVLPKDKLKDVIKKKESLLSDKKRNKKVARFE